MKKWKSLYIYYISGTGNARMSCDWIADEARKSGIDTVVQKIDRLEGIIFPEPSPDLLIGFAFPTHGFNAAPIMLKFMAGFPAKLCNNIFQLNTRAGMKMSKLFTPGLSGLALILPAFMLRMKGYKCIGYRPVDMPSNWIPLHPGIKHKVIDSIFTRCEAVVRKFAIRTINGEKTWNGLYSLPVDLLISPLAFGYYVAGRFFLSKTFIANSNCNLCLKCVKECPTASIRIVNDKPYWKLSCESCMRCLNMCPERAIEAAHGMAVGFYFLIILLNTKLALLISDLSGLPDKSGLLKITSSVTSLILTVFVPAFAYFVIHYAIGLKPVNGLFRWTSLTTFRFWRRYRAGMSNGKK